MVPDPSSSNSLNQASNTPYETLYLGPLIYFRM
jgi:hypothetical protein